VSDHGEQLREAFETHENLAPDPAAVYARVQDLSRTYKRRRRGAQIAGGAVLSAGLVAGVVTVPSLLVNRPSNAVTQIAPAAASSAPPSQAELQKDWDAYFAAGYDYDDAVGLAKTWKSTGDIASVKAEAGRRLLAGEKLPFEGDPSTAEEVTRTKEVDAFFAAGYGYDDAVRLAKLWHKKDTYQVKGDAGKKLLAGEKLPFKPQPVKGNPTEVKTQKQLDAYFAAGYDYTDAVTLAKLWKQSDPYQAKILAGKKLLAGQTLPIKP